MVYLIIAYLVSNPNFFIVGQEFRPAQEFFFRITGLFLILCSMFFNKYAVKWSKLNISVALLGLVACFQYVINDFIGFNVLINLFVGIMLYFTLISTLKREDLGKITTTIMWVGVFTLIVLFFQLNGFDLRGSIIKNTTDGIPDCSIFALAAHMGIYLGIFMMVMIAVSWWALLIFIPLIVAKSTGAMVACGISVLFYMWFKARKVFYIAIPFIVAGVISFIVLYDNPMGMQKTRIDCWGKVAQMSWRSPLGKGLGSFRNDEREGAVKFYKYKYSNETFIVYKEDGQLKLNSPNVELLERMKTEKNLLDWWDHPHNEYVWLLWEFGFLGIIVLGFLLYYLWQRFFYSKRSKQTVALMGALLSVILVSVTQFPFHVARIGHIIPVLLAMFYISTDGEDITQG